METRQEDASRSSLCVVESRPYLPAKNWVPYVRTFPKDTDFDLSEVHDPFVGRHPHLFGAPAALVK